MNVIEPLFERQFIFDSYANRVDKGTHQALDRCTCYLRRNRYVMHLDVKQFFPSIDHEILLKILSKTIMDAEVIHLIQGILCSGANIQRDEYELRYFPGDDLLAALRPRGLPIGNLTSQHWANVYLNDLDQYVKRKMKIKAYIRYVDDILLFSGDKKQLFDWKQKIIQFLAGLRLTLHESKAHAKPSESGVTFLGFQVFPDYRRLKPDNGYAFQRRLKSLVNLVDTGRMDQGDLDSRLRSWNAHARFGDTYRLRCRLLGQEKVAQFG